MKKGQKGFTLVEVITASSIALVVLAGVIMIMIMALNAWAVGTADVRLERSGTMIMEKIARGISGRFGLREAHAKSIVIDEDARGVTFAVDKNEDPTVTTDDDTTVRIYFEKDSRRVMYDTDADKQGKDIELSMEGGVEDIRFRRIGDVLNINLMMTDTVTSSIKKMQMQCSTSLFLRKAPKAKINVTPKSETDIYEVQ